MGIKLGRVSDNERALSSSSAAEQKEIATQLVRQLSFISQVQRRSDNIKSTRFMLITEPSSSPQHRGGFVVEVVRKRGYRDAVARVFVGDDQSLSHVELKKAIEQSAQSGQPMVLD